MKGAAASIWAKLSVVLTVYTIYNQVKTLNQLKDEVYSNIPEDLRDQLAPYVSMPANVQVTSPIPSAIAIPTYVPRVSAYEHLKSGT